MKNILLTVAASFGVSTAAFAHSPAPTPTPAPAAITVAPPAAMYTDWSGFYIGGMASLDGGELDYFLADVLLTELDYLATNSFGAFVGFNKQVNALVFGGELAFSTGDMGFEIFTESILLDRTDVKARVGYSFGQALAYGILGYSWATFDDAGGIFPSAGVNYGVGFDYMVTDRVFVGAEYLIRNLTGESGAERFVSDTNTLSIRGGMKF